MMESIFELLTLFFDFLKHMISLPLFPSNFAQKHRGLLVSVAHYQYKADFIFLNHPLWIVVEADHQ